MENHYSTTICVLIIEALTQKNFAFILVNDSLCHFDHCSHTEEKLCIRKGCIRSQIFSWAHCVPTLFLIPSQTAGHAKIEFEFNYTFNLCVSTPISLQACYFGTEQSIAGENRTAHVLQSSDQMRQLILPCLIGIKKGFTSLTQGSEFEEVSELSLR